MKAKIRVDNVPQARRDVWDTMSEAYLRERMDAMTVALQSALTKLIESPELRKTLASNARKTVEQRFSFDKRMEKMRALYDSLEE